MIVEKPIGHDLASAMAINDAIAAVFDERQIFRIDHYLGKETVQNILVLRFANSFFEPLVQPAVHRSRADHGRRAEGVGTRAGYYEQAGALRDMVQNHLLQLLALVAMEPPHSLDADVVRDEKLEVIQSLRPITGEDVDRFVVRGQYAAGVGGRQAGARLPARNRASTRPRAPKRSSRCRCSSTTGAGPACRSSCGPASDCQSAPAKSSIHLKAVPPILFNARPERRLEPNVLTIRIQPDEGFALRISSKVPGTAASSIEPVDMDFTLQRHVRRQLARGVRAAAARRDGRRRHAVHAPRPGRGVVELDHADSRSLGRTVRDRSRATPAGTWGPAEADRLIEADRADDGTRSEVRQ